MPLILCPRPEGRGNGQLEHGPGVLSAQGNPALVNKGCRKSYALKLPRPSGRGLVETQGAALAKKRSIQKIAE
ncbi:hypothetical protein [Mucilaginibacter arboris]|uniref:Uncharacterized protein n=1 Tax=Mucilaginibacter arboris TaxID=2682090 RepID=A0A7K1STN4_9SPHI|nr:hypothetical protein [Mucilaginibacter arboris]MVN20676.1 hypothetical protein [Mucilaginibacter arboris]